MSNKMLWKRLLAAGMSIALSATLFATNSITTFAEGDVPALEEEQPSSEAEVETDAGDPDPVIAGNDPASWAPEPTPEEIVDEIEASKTIDVPVEGKEKTIDRTVVVVEVTKEYYSDMDSQDGDGNQGDEYNKVEDKSVIGEDQKLDFIDVEEIKEEGEVTVYLEDEEGNPATVKNCEGEDVVLELPENFDIEKQTKEVVVVDTAWGLKELNKKEINSIIYGYFDDNGKFIETEKDAEGAEGYVYSQWGFKKTDSIYSTVNIDGEKVYIDEETYKALNGDESKYKAVKEYTYNDETYTEEQLDQIAKEKKAELTVDKWTATVKEPDYPERWKIITKNAFNPYDPGKEIPAYLPCLSYEVTGTKNGKFTVDYTFLTDNGEVLIGTLEKSAYEMPWGTSVGSTGTYDYPHYEKFDSRVESQNIHKNIEGKSTDYEFSKVTVYDENNNVVFTGDKRAYKRLKEANVTEVGDKVRVDLGYWNYVYVDKHDYTLIREHEENLTVTEKFYYTVQDKGKQEAKEVEFTMNGQDYKLNVEFWENSRIGITGITITPTDEGPKVVVDYAYSTYNGTEMMAPYESYEKVIPFEKFSSLGEATLKVKYLPIYFNTDNVEQIQQPVYPILIPVREIRMLTLMADTRLFELDVNILKNLFEEAGVEVSYDPELEIFENDNKSHRLLVVGPDDDVIKGEEPTPQPNPGPNPDVTPDTTPSTPTTIDVTPVALAAAPGQVLGAQRVEPVAGEAPAVLGASRARGTADETTAPFVRVLVMAAVASAALFLTRKREEKN